MLLKQIIQAINIKKIDVYLDDLEDIACKPNKLIKTHNILIIINGN